MTGLLPWEKGRLRGREIVAPGGDGDPLSPGEGHAGGSTTAVSRPCHAGGDRVTRAVEPHDVEDLGAMPRKGPG